MSKEQNCHTGVSDFVKMFMKGHEKLNFWFPLEHGKTQLWFYTTSLELIHFLNLLFSTQ